MTKEQILNCYQARVSFPFQFPVIEPFLEDSDQEPAIAAGASSLQTFPLVRCQTKKLFICAMNTIFTSHSASPRQHFLILALSVCVHFVELLNHLQRNCRFHDISLKKFQHVSPKKKDVPRHNHNTMAPSIIHIKISLVSFIADTIFSFF